MYYYRILPIGDASLPLLRVASEVISSSANRVAATRASVLRELILILLILFKFFRLSKLVNLVFFDAIL